jgi:hypothetical protein
MDRLAQDRVSPGLARFIERLSQEDKESLVGILREPQTFIAEDMMDVLAILRQLKSGNSTQENLEEA